MLEKKHKKMLNYVLNYFSEDQWSITKIKLDPKKKKQPIILKLVQFVTSRPQLHISEYSDHIGPVIINDPIQNDSLNGCKVSKKSD